LKNELPYYRSKIRKILSIISFFLWSLKPKTHHLPEKEKREFAGEIVWHLYFMSFGSKRLNKDCLFIGCLWQVSLRCVKKC
jgi:hypothetical protein